MASQRIADTDFTVDWVVDKILKDLGEEDANPKVKSWDAKHISVGQGFLSRIFKLKLEWEEKNPKLPHSVVLKVPTSATVSTSLENMEATRKASAGTRQAMLDGMETMVDFVIMGHTNECEFYTLFNDKGIDMIPHLYYGVHHSREEPGIIIMDDLSGSSGNVDFAAGLNKCQVLQVIDVLAAVHAYSLKNSEWKDTFKPMSREQVETMPTMVKLAAGQLKMMKPEYFSRADEQMSWIADPDMFYELPNHSHEKVGMPAVLVHGDLWSNNLMFKKKDGVVGDKLEAVIDWQITHPGNFAEDIGRLLVSSCSAELRHAELENVLLFYADKLTKHLGYKHKDFTLEKMMAAYEAIFPFSMIFYVFGVPMMAESPVVEGPDKKKKVEALMLRAKAALEDVAVFKEKFEK